MEVDDAQVRGKVTIQEIADLAGVSKFAVSRALSGKSGVSAHTREMIMKAAGQLGYFKTNNAKRFGGEQPSDHELKAMGTIVVLFPNIRFQNKDSVYWGPLFDGISSQLNRRGLDILTLTEPSGDHLFALLKPEAIQGIVTVGSISTPILLDIQRLNIPVVMVDHMDPAFQCDTVFTDNFTCMKEMMTKLVSKGYKSYQFVGNIHDAQSFYERWIAFKTVLEEYGIQHNQASELIGPDGNEIWKTIPAYPLDKLPEVFVCAHDTSARFLIEELEKRGIKVPQQCAVTGFDNTEDQAPIMATFDIDKELIGRRAVDQLLWRISNRNCYFEKKLIYADLLIREQFHYIQSESE